MHPLMPKYVQVMEIIKDDIQRQVLLADDQLPNEDELAAKYQMSRGTIRKAIAELQHMGLVRKEQGRGTFVNALKPVLNGFSLVEFDQSIRQQNRMPSTQTITFEIIPATKSLAEKLAVKSDTALIHLVQLRLADNIPLVYEERYFDQALCPNITLEEIEKYSIHWLLVEKYQIPLIRLMHNIEIADLPTDKFELFGLRQSVSVFAVDRLSYTRINGDIRPAVCYQALYRADDYQFHAQFHSSI